MEATMPRRSVAQTQTETLWQTLNALRTPLSPSDRTAAANTLWQTARCAATPGLRDRALEAMARFGLVVTRISSGGAA